ncbi:hypothetical protein NC651_000599 [Populus alba x Populus x berolinensis]|nr:hypothetical protein NC651_000599 [Populus alba x Populus x berolinensis]
MKGSSPSTSRKTCLTSLYNINRNIEL